jgi:hypothetical protein
MQMYKPILLAVFIFITQVSYAQHYAKKTSKHNHKNDWDFDHRLSLKVTPTSLADPYGSLLAIGAEYYFKEKSGISLDVGIPLFYNINNSRYGNYKHINSDFKLRADFRQYFGFCKNNRFFAGPEVFYRNQSMNLQNSYFHFLDNVCYRFSSAKANKSIFGFGAIAGISHKFSDHFFLEGNLGIGLRIINMTPQFEANSANSFFKGTFVSLELPNEDRVGDHDLNIYLPFAIKLSYLF